MPMNHIICTVFLFSFTAERTGLTVSDLSLQVVVQHILQIYFLKM